MKNKINCACLKSMENLYHLNDINGHLLSACGALWPVWSLNNGAETRQCALHKSTGSRTQSSLHRSFQLTASHQNHLSINIININCPPYLPSLPFLRFGSSLALQIKRNTYTHTHTRDLKVYLKIVIEK